MCVCVHTCVHTQRFCVITCRWMPMHMCKVSKRLKQLVVPWGSSQLFSIINYLHPCVSASFLLSWSGRIMWHTLLFSKSVALLLMLTGSFTLWQKEPREALSWFSCWSCTPSSPPSLLILRSDLGNILLITGFTVCLYTQNKTNGCSHHLSLSLHMYMLSISLSISGFRCRFIPLDQ